MAAGMVTYSAKAPSRLTPMPPGVKAWATLGADEKKLFAHQMEVFAGFAEHTDMEVGRLIDALEEIAH